MAWIGTSGWSYDHWDDVLYHGARPADRLGIYTSEFATVELNASFYRWPRDASFASWQRRLPEGFRITVKAPRVTGWGERRDRAQTTTAKIARR